MRVFISYRHIDIGPASEVRRELEKRGHQVALVAHRLENPTDVIVNRLRTTDLLMVVVGERAFKSAWVSAEVLAATTLGLPLVCTLVQRTYRPPTTVPQATVVLNLPDLRRNGYKEFDVFPSAVLQRRLQEEYRNKVHPYWKPGKDKLEAPVVNHGNLLLIALHAFAYVAMGIAYLVGFFLPNLLYALLASGSGNPKVHTIIFLAWQVAFWFILFSNPYRRLAYPLWVLWFFRDRVPAWLAAQPPALARRMADAMRGLSATQQNRQFWKREMRLRKGDEKDNTSVDNGE